MVLITEKDIADIKAALVELAPFTEEPIIYKQFDRIEQGDPVLGRPDTLIFTEDSTVASAMVKPLTVEEVLVSGGYYVMGDMEFSIRRTTQPAYQDRIVYGGATWKPKGINPVYLGEVLWWEVRVGKE